MSRNIRVTRKAPWGIAVPGLALAVAGCGQTSSEPPAAVPRRVRRWAQAPAP